MERQVQFNLRCVMTAVIRVLFLRDVWVNVTQLQPIPYCEFEHHLKTEQPERA